VFDLSQVTEPVYSASLQIQTGYYDSPYSSENYQLSSLPSGFDTSDPEASFGSLGYGNVYADQTYSSGADGAVLTINLGGTALTDINAA
jgi:hypothetical protein